MQNIQDKREFEAAIQALEAQAVNVGLHMVVDAEARQLYSRQIKRFSEELKLEVKQGKISWKEAAKKANETRNVIMEIVRGKSTPVGNAYAQQLKSKGRTLNELVAKKTNEIYLTKHFNDLTVEQKNRVYSEIVKSSGKSNPDVNRLMKNISSAGRGLIVLSIGLSVYTIATSENKLETASREALVAGAGIGGGIAGGAIAGLACGLGAPVCVSVGAFIGGTLAAFGVSIAW